MTLVRLFQFPIEGVTPENVRAHTSAPFNEHRGGSYYHHGTDLGFKAGTPIYPIYKGVVDSWGTNQSTYGNWVRIKHDPSSYSYYYHMLDRSNYDTGQPVSKTDAIGWVGSTGDSTGPHLHFGVSGVANFSGWVDPVQYVLDRYWYENGVKPPAPLPVKPSTRHTAGWPVGFRALADLSEANIAKILPPGTMVDAVWWQNGDGAGSGQDKFLLVKQGGQQGYIHLGDIVESGLDGVPEYEGQIPKPIEPIPDSDPIPDPTPEPEPEPGRELSTADIPVIAVAVADEIDRREVVKHS